MQAYRSKDTSLFQAYFGNKKIKIPRIPSKKQKFKRTRRIAPKYDTPGSYAFYPSLKEVFSPLLAKCNQTSSMMAISAASPRRGPVLVIRV